LIHCNNIKTGVPTNTTPMIIKAIKKLMIGPTIGISYNRFKISKNAPMSHKTMRTPTYIAASEHKMLKTNIIMGLTHILHF
jgi:hypothetical protein